MIMVVIMLVVSKIRDTVDDRPGAAHQLIHLVLLDRLIVEGGRVQQRLDLGGQGITLGRDVADGGEEPGVARIVAEDRAVRKAQAVKSHRAEGRVELLVDLGEFEEVFAPPQ